jgi:hypothetical protein
MTNQKLFEALERLCGFTVLQSDMFEIIRAVEADKMGSNETIEQAAERYADDIGNKNGTAQFDFIRGAKWQSSQPNPHLITVVHVGYLLSLVDKDEITTYRMVEILNEIAEGKHKERIEI